MSKNIVLDIENVSKQYRLGEVGTGSLQHDIKRWWYNVRGLEDPYLKIGEANDRTQKGESDYVWALRDINFQVEQGQAVGIIGRNGAGKSTLLKLLSRVTKPTTGSIKYKGRIASLLEVGTGFHPEMTGRENIYLNGAILGMTRKEISRKFDEIVDFAGVERYIDTPVKRYSSGMYVRLAFAVAAHLESEILIVDEVLAVGDAEFQKKCLGKMGDISKGEGRTVLFVSHNMASIQNLCDQSILMGNGQVINQGKTDDIINNYLIQYKTKHVDLINVKNRLGNQSNRFVDLKIYSEGEAEGIIESFKNLVVEIHVEKPIDWSKFKGQIDVGINNNYGDRIAWLSTSNTFMGNLISNRFKILIKNNPIAPGDYTMNLFMNENNETVDWIKDVSPFSVAEKDYYKSGKIIPSNQGNILLNYEKI